MTFSLLQGIRVSRSTHVKIDEVVSALKSRSVFILLSKLDLYIVLKLLSVKVKYKRDSDFPLILGYNFTYCVKK